MRWNSPRVNCRTRISTVWSAGCHFAAHPIKSKVSSQTLLVKCLTCVKPLMSDFSIQPFERLIVSCQKKGLLFKVFAFKGFAFKRFQLTELNLSKVLCVKLFHYRQTGEPTGPNKHSGQWFRLKTSIWSGHQQRLVAWVAQLRVTLAGRESLSVSQFVFLARSHCTAQTNIGSAISARLII